VGIQKVRKIKYRREKAEEKPKKSNAEGAEGAETEIDNERLHLAEMGRSSAAPLPGNTAQA
jgi:hypothetical protein